MELLRKTLKYLTNSFQCSYRHIYMMYLFIFGLPLIVTVVLTETSATALERQIQASTAAMTQQAQTTIDSRMDDISLLINQINNHSALRYLLNRSDPLKNTERYMVITVISDLRKQYANSSIVRDLFVYWTFNDSVITPTTHVSSRFFYNKYSYYEGVSYEQWLGWMEEYHDMEILPAQTVYVDDQPVRSITVLQTLPRGESWRMTGVLTLLIDEEWLLGQVATARSIEGAEFFLVNTDGQVILGSGGSLDSGAIEGFGTEGLLYETIDGRNYMLSYCKSMEREWYCVLRIPMDKLFATTDGLRLTIRVALIAVIIIGLALAGLLAYMSFTPVRSIISTIQETDSKSMIDRLRRRVSFYDLGALMEEALKNTNAYEKQLPILIENYVFKLIHGSRDVESDLSLLSEVLSFRFPSNVFSVLCVQIQKGDEAVILGTYRDVQEVMGQVQSAEDAGMSFYSTLATENIIAILVSFWAGHAEGYREMLHRQADRIMRLMQKKSGRRYAIGIGLVVNDYGGIAGSYRQALMCVAGAPSDECILFYADIARVVPPIDYSYPLETEKILIGCVCTGDAKRMRKIIDEIFKIHGQETRLSADMVLCLKYDMLSTLYKCMQELQGDEAENQEHLAALIRKLMVSGETIEIYECLLEAFERLCTQAYKGKRTHNDSLCDRIIGFIRANFSNPDMGLDMVARSFGIAPSYLSRFFKEQTGGNFIDYLNRLRIEHAANLLRTTNLSHAEIAERCGMSGSQSLNRLFNRVLSISPSAYRQMARDGLFDGSIVSQVRRI